jgi:hypothetical protein
LRSGAAFQASGETDAAATGGIALIETANRAVFVGEHIEDGVKLRDLQKISHLLRKLQQLQITALIFYRRESAHQLADSRTVNVIDVGEIQEDSFPLVLEESTYRFAKQSAAVTEGNPAAQIDYGNLPGVAMRGA